MSKIRKYKIGDKVFIADDVKTIGEHNTFYNDKIYIVTSIADSGRGIITSLDNINCCLDVRRFEYKYEKSLEELSNKIGIRTHPNYRDYDLIETLINQQNTLTEKELKKCGELWNKYNKNNL